MNDCRAKNIKQTFTSFSILFSSSISVSDPVKQNLLHKFIILFLTYQISLKYIFRNTIARLNNLLGLCSIYFYKILAWVLNIASSRYKRGICLKTAETMKRLFRFVYHEIGSLPNLWMNAHVMEMNGDHVFCRLHITSIN